MFDYEAMPRFETERLVLREIEPDADLAALYVLEKLGFQEESLLRQRGHWRGEYFDLRFFGLLREDWSG